MKVKLVNVTEQNIVPTGMLEIDQAHDEKSFNEANESLVKNMVKAAKKAEVKMRNNMFAAQTDLEAMGYKFAFCKGNRPINSNSVKRLLSLVSTSKFSAPGRVTSAKAALVHGEALIDENGNELSLETEGIETFLVIIDGQHRFIACRQSQIEGKSIIDMDFEIVDCPDDLEEEIVRFNCGSTNWGSEDFRQYNAKKKGIADTLAEATEEGREILPIASQKFLEYALTGKKDAVRKSAIMKGEVPSCDEGTKTVGMSILKIFALLANICPKVANVEMLSGVMDLKTEKTAVKYTGEFFCNHLLSALANATEEWKLGLKSKIEAKDWSGIKKELSDCFDEHKEKETPTDEDMKKLDSSLQAISASLKKPVKGIPNGSAYVVLSSIRDKKKNTETIKKLQENYDAAKKALTAAKKNAAL